MQKDRTVYSNIRAGSRLGYYYHCKVTDAQEVWYSNPVKVEQATSIVLDEVTYEIIPGTENVFVKAYSGTASSLIIPSTVEGHTVTEIGEEAFMGKESLVSITHPNTIMIIHARAFKNCTNLSAMNSQ